MTSEQIAELYREWLEADADYKSATQQLKECRNKRDEASSRMMNAIAQAAGDESHPFAADGSKRFVYFD